MEYILGNYGESPLQVLELGSGCGIVSIMLGLHRPLWQVSALELQPEQVTLSRENARLCDCSVSFTEGDLRTWTGNSYDLIVANPPWLPVGKGLSSPIPQRRIGREETNCTMQDVLEAFIRLKTPEGEAVLIYPLNRQAEMQSRTAKSSLDIIDLVHTDGLKQYFICRLKTARNQ